MKLSRFRRFRAAGKGPTASASKPKLHLYLGAFASMILGLAASLYFFFPASALEERIEYEIHGSTPVEADILELSLSFPPALRAEKLTLNIGNPQPYAVSFENASVKPLWHSLFGRDPGVIVHTRILGGEGEGTIRRNGGMELSLAGILFDAPLPSLTSLRLSGNVEKGVFTGAVPVKPTTESHLQVQLEKVMITGLKSVGIDSDTLSLGAISLQGAGRGNTFRIEQLNNQGGDLKVSGSGTVLLGRTIEQSRLNLNVSLSPEQSMDRNLAELFTLLKQPARDGSYRFRITGTIAAPVIK